MEGRRASEKLERLPHFSMRLRWQGQQQAGQQERRLAAGLSARPRRFGMQACGGTKLSSLGIAAALGSPGAVGPSGDSEQGSSVASARLPSRPAKTMQRE